MTDDYAAALDDAKMLIRQVLGTFNSLDRHQAVVCLSIFADRIGPGAYDGPRLDPSTHEDRLYRYLAVCDVDNLVAMRTIKPDAVQAFAVWSYEPHGVDRLTAVARGDADPGPADAPFAPAADPPRRAEPDCRCVHDCADDPPTACSLSGDWHVHPDDGTGTFGACPAHPDAPGDL